MTRERPANRRVSESLSFEHNGHKFVATISRFTDGRLGEIFISNGHIGSDTDAAARDGAVVASIALQHGIPVQKIQHALLRDSRGVAS